MTKRLNRILGFSTLIFCTSVLVITPWPTADAIFSTHASPTTQL